MPTTPSAFEGDRLAKVIARAGLCSRRDAELWIKEGRVAVNGKVIRTPAFNVTPRDEVKVDGAPLAAREGTRVWLYHKPAGLVVTEKDPEGRPTIFEALAEQGLPRIVSIGRLDINTEGLLLLTNDGGLKRVLELPATGWLRRYRVRAFGNVTQPQLDQLKQGVEVEGVKYGPIEATLERAQGSNVWLLVALREGKNREVKNVLAALGLKVNRLIRISFGPFQLGDLPIGAVEVVKARILREQLGKRLADEAGVDFDSELPEPTALKLARRAADPNARIGRPGRDAGAGSRHSSPAAKPRGRGTGEAGGRSGPRPEFGSRRSSPAAKPRGRGTGEAGGGGGPRRGFAEDRAAPPSRRVFHDDGSVSEFVPRTYGKKPRPAATDDRPRREFRSRDSSARKAGEADRPKRAGGRGPKRDFAPREDRPRTRPSGAGPKRPRGSGPGGDRPRRPRPPRA